MMVLLGLGVRNGATPIDGFFQQAHNSPLSSLLFFTDYRTANTLVAATVLTALYRRLWLLVPLAVVVPYLAVHATEMLKPWFGRMKEEGLAYPSGHTTAIIAVLGMLILAAGARRWLVLAAVVFAVLGMVQHTQLVRARRPATQGKPVEEALRQAHSCRLMGASA